MLFLSATHKKRRAFSLLEVSITIMIIGILLVAVIGSKQMIKRSRLLAAQAETRSSPISSISDNKLWLESSLDEVSLGEGLATGDSITTWLDSSLNKDAATIAVEGSGPTYSNSINHVQAVKFDSTSATNHLKIVNPEFLNNTDYTIIILENKLANNPGGGNYLLGASGSFALGYETEGTIIQTHGEAASGVNQASVEATYSDKPRMLVFTHTSAHGNKIYVNGTLANEDSSDEAKAHLVDLSTSNPLKIGNNYNGEIGEIVIFDRYLRNRERKDIENYLTDKWAAPNNREVAASCTDGTVISTGCFAVTCTASGIGYDKTGLSYTTGGTFSCDSGYNGTINYECLTSGSVTNVSGTCTADTCTASGVGYDKTGLAYAASGSGGSFACDSGYEGTINYTCETSGAATEVSGSCSELPINCSSDVADSTSVPGQTMHIFTTVGESTLDCSSGGSGVVDILLVAGGGGGGGTIGGGGGAGGVLYSTGYAISSGSYTVKVGDGGIGGTGYNSATQGGTVGENSTFEKFDETSTITAYGGGGGGHHGGASTTSNRNGGSGGGGSRNNVTVPPGTPVSGQGHIGGTPGDLNYHSGGGGGAGGQGGDATSGHGGDAGPGVNYSAIVSSNYGDSGWFASGGAGGGGGGSSVLGSASIGGGGAGSQKSVAASPGQANTGGGGGGAGFDTPNSLLLGGKGGSGIVIVIVKDL